MGSNIVENTTYQIWGIVGGKPWETLGLSSDNLEFLEGKLEEINSNPDFVQELCPDTDISIFEKFEILPE